LMHLGLHPNEPIYLRKLSFAFSSGGYWTVAISIFPTDFNQRKDLVSIHSCNANINGIFINADNVIFTPCEMGGTFHALLFKDLFRSMTGDNGLKMLPLDPAFENTKSKLYVTDFPFPWSNYASINGQSVFVNETVTKASALRKRGPKDKDLVLYPYPDYDEGIKIFGDYSGDFTFSVAMMRNELKSGLYVKNPKCAKMNNENTFWQDERSFVWDISMEDCGDDNTSYFEVCLNTEIFKAAENPRLSLVGRGKQASPEGKMHLAEGCCSRTMALKPDGYWGRRDAPQEACFFFHATDKIMGISNYSDSY